MHFNRGKNTEENHTDTEMKDSKGQCNSSVRSLTNRMGHEKALQETGIGDRNVHVQIKLVRFQHHEKGQIYKLWEHKEDDFMPKV